MSIRWSMLVMLASACVESGDPLGIERYEIQDRATGVTIVGRDAAGGTVGEVALDTGRFTLSDDGRDVDGRRLTVKVRGETITHESEGFYVLALPALPATERYSALNAFLRAPAVTGTLMMWGVGIDHRDTFAAGAQELASPPTTAEVPSNTCTYSGCASTGTHSCDMTDNAEDFYPSGCQYIWDEVRCCNKSGANGAFAFRRCGPTNSCGVPGSGGCAVCWQDTWQSYCDTGRSGPTAMECYDGSTTLEYDYRSLWFSYD